MSTVATEATREEFGLWYEEQAGTPVRRLLCAFAARVAGGPAPGPFARALVRVLDRHPECRSTFAVDADGRLVKTPDAGPAVGVPVFGPEHRPSDVVGALAREPLSAVTGPVLRLAVRVDRSGAVDHVFGVAHHVVWDGRSEELFWDALARELAGEPTGTGPLDDPPVTVVRSREGGPDDTTTDPQWMVVLGDQTWDRARRRARENALTPFAWVVGHLATGVAAWSGQAVTPYIDVDLRAVDDGARDRIGYFQTQRRLREVDLGVPGPEAARRVLADVAGLAARALTTGLPPERETPRPDTRACKFYLRAPRPDREGGVLSPVDIALPVARNDLAVGVTSEGSRVRLTVTARQDLFGLDEPARLGRRLLTALDTAAHGSRQGDEEA
ncbi:hypothetical protein ABZ816_15550 [Actinosynnema sp. NPDC047251]|uniref:Condensation domain-containing protein n=1 Tax=Saccharothrix espanaensis (strain ATCC 51144 / DSM 44229 / JCM 9112 / NBRC 15066 / NRRL 15764) TaxID=1179773 RepID=K0JUG7_SACES|nr:hypothetical protein [Saccharothrix espanaensis]CCH29566.1 hypothetical protein BN6_22450 [Saccharothrix espanaensis DSM 44229]